MRLVILSDANVAATETLVRATLRLARRRPEVEVVALVTARPEAFRVPAVRQARRAARRALLRAANGRAAPGGTDSRGGAILRAAAKAHVPLVVPPGGDPNDPAFVRYVRGTLRPDAALSFYCFRKLRREVIDALGGVVNYHDALLPAHRGVWATSFSILQGDARTGFTFHWMDEGLDTGPVLVQGAIPDDGRSGLAHMDRAKARHAAAELPAVLDLIAARAPGVAQTGSPSYHSRVDGDEARHIDAPGALPAAEILRRVRAFGEVRMTIGDSGLPVTRLSPCDPDHPLAVRTADGVLLAPDRIAGLPPRLEVLRRRLRGEPAPAVTSR